MKRPRRVLRWRTRLALLLVAFSVGPLILFAWFGTDIMERSSREASLEALSALAAAKAEAVDQFTDYRRRDVERLAELLGTEVRALRDAEKEASKPKEPEDLAPPLPPLNDAGKVGSQAVPGAPTPKPELKPDETPENPRVVESRRALKKTLGLLLWDQRSFEELLIMDPEGRVVVATFDQHEGRSAKDLEYFKKGLKATFVQPVFQSPITENFTMVIATPIRDLEGRDLGVLAARLNLKRFYTLIGDTTGLGETGETIVGKKIDDKVTFMAPTRHDAAAAASRHIAVGSEQEPALQRAARGQSGVGETTDYRGEHVLAAWQHIPALEWGLVVKMDRSEALSSVREARKTTLILALLLGVLSVLAAFLVARPLVQPLQNLRDATERISKGDFAIEMKSYPPDEIGELADSFERMVAAIKFFRAHSRRPDEDPDELLDDEASIG